MCDYIKILKTMRAGEWAKAKGHLIACCNTFWKNGEDHVEQFDVFHNLVEEFIHTVEDGGLVE